MAARFHFSVRGSLGSGFVLRCGCLRPQHKGKAAFGHLPGSKMGKRACDGTAAKPAAVKKAKAKAKPQAERAGRRTSATTAEPPANEQLPTNVCGPMLQNIHGAMPAIKAHAIFKGITSALPLDIGEGGAQAAFKQSACETALGNGNYVAAANFSGKT